MSQAVLDQILSHKIIAIVRSIPSEEITGLARALLDGGICCMEITFDQSSPEKEADTLAAIRSIKKTFNGEICIGAGTVMSVRQVRQAAEAGAEYMISPNICEAVIRETKALNKVSIPGAMTPTEIDLAHSCGADLVKLFPADTLGPAYIKSLRAPLRHIPIVAVGGITASNCGLFLEAGALGIGAGGSLVSPRLVHEGRFDEITRTASAYVEALRS